MPDNPEIPWVRIAPEGTVVFRELPDGRQESMTYDSYLAAGGAPLPWPPE